LVLASLKSSDLKCEIEAKSLSSKFEKNQAHSFLLDIQTQSPNDVLITSRRLVNIENPKSQELQAKHGFRLSGRNQTESIQHASSIMLSKGASNIDAGRNKSEKSMKKLCLQKDCFVFSPFPI